MSINKSAGPCPLCKSDLENYKYIFINKDGKEETHDGVRCTNTKDGVKTGKNCKYNKKGKCGICNSWCNNGRCNICQLKLKNVKDIILKTREGKRLY